MLKESFIPYHPSTQVQRNINTHICNNKKKQQQQFFVSRKAEDERLFDTFLEYAKVYFVGGRMFRGGLFLNAFKSKMKFK